MIEIPLGLRTALETGDCVLFVGAGIGKHVSDDEGKPAPDSESLAKELAEYFTIETGGVYDLAKISKIVEIRKGRRELQAYLHKRLANLRPDKSLQWLFSLRWKAIYTTNYDNAIQRAYEIIPDPPQNPVTLTVTSDLTPYNPQFEVPVYHLHGTLFASSEPNIVITEDDYARFKERRRMLFELLKNDFATSTVLYIGYSNRDPNWRTVIAEISSEFYPSKLPKSYRIAPDTDSLDVEILRAKNIETILVPYQEFYEAASLVLSELKVDKSFLRKIEKDVAPDLLPIFSKSPAALARLLSSWTYVNQAPFHEEANIQSFLRGNEANWALIAGEHYFERDIEEEIYNDLLDYATDTKSVPRASIILAPAGYGVTTLLRILAVKLVKEKAGPVFMLKPGHRFIEGDIEFASSIFPDVRPFFFLNSAADHSSPLYSIVHQLREAHQSAMFVLGERLNEWRQGHGRLVPKEYLLGTLTDPEINRLIDCLDKHSELGALEPLTRELQFATIKSKHSKELLVAMREATEGKSFDAILEDEYRGIGDNTSRRVYLVVCCFHQHGALVRDALLATLMGIPLTDLYKLTRDSTEGVVIFECLDKIKESYVARSRHRIIATVVWERCGHAEEKESLIQSSLSALNLNYGADRDALEHFFRSDRLVDSIRTLDGRIRFFETACKKDPESPYIRQHYARMLSRTNRPDLALSQIEEALKINSDGLVLHHTRGVILMQLAMSIESLDLARRRLAQSEASFRRALSIFQRDEYSFQGLAQLYLGWAKRVPTEEECAEYISKAEGIISEGLKVVQFRDSLWIESSNIQQWLKDEPSRLRALEKAVESNPGSIIARYLLGRAYRRANLPEKTIEVLEPIIRNHTDEFRSFVEYAIALICLKRPYKEAIAVLKLSTLYGLGDPRFIATLGGLLFLEKQFTEANAVFVESGKRNFTGTELNSVQFRPPNPGNIPEPIRLRGAVAVVKAGYALVETDIYPRLICPSSKFGGVIMKAGLRASFELGFTAKGPVLSRPGTET